VLFLTCHKSVFSLELAFNSSNVVLIAVFFSSNVFIFCLRLSISFIVSSNSDISFSICDIFLLYSLIVPMNI
jgi:hypothetical protein